MSTESRLSQRSRSLHHSLFQESTTWTVRPTHKAHLLSQFVSGEEPGFALQALENLGGGEIVSALLLEPT
jgi:hypothetical protein